jgi:hypothetical protein
MKCSEFKSESGSELNINNSMIQGLHIEPYDVPLVFMAPGSKSHPNPRVPYWVIQTYNNTRKTQAYPLHTNKFTSKA